jgi:hypothetical protein
MDLDGNHDKLVSTLTSCVREFQRSNNPRTAQDAVAILVAFIASLPPDMLYLTCALALSMRSDIFENSASVEVGFYLPALVEGYFLPNKHLIWII